MDLRWSSKTRVRRREFLIQIACLACLHDDNSGRQKSASSDQLDALGRRVTHQGDNHEAQHARDIRHVPPKITVGRGQLSSEEHGKRPRRNRNDLEDLTILTFLKQCYLAFQARKL